MFVYPAYASYKTIEFTKKRDYYQWISYWIIVAVLRILETSLFRVLFDSSNFGYFCIKMGFIIYLYNPSTEGATEIYHSFLKNIVSPLLNRSLKSQQKQSFVSIRNLTLRLKSPLRGDMKYVCTCSLGDHRHSTVAVALNSDSLLVEWKDDDLNFQVTPTNSPPYLLTFSITDKRTFGEDIQIGRGQGQETRSDCDIVSVGSDVAESKVDNVIGTLSWEIKHI